jgi:hypothetical protein
VDGDLLRSQLWQRGVMNGPGSGAAGGSGDGNMVNVGGGPMNSGMGPNSPTKPKSMPHMALPFDMEFTGSGIGGPSQFEGNHPASGAETTQQPTSTGNKFRKKSRKKCVVLLRPTRMYWSLFSFFSEAKNLTSKSLERTLHMSRVKQRNVRGKEQPHATRYLFCLSNEAHNAKVWDHVSRMNWGKKKM